MMKNINYRHYWNTSLIGLLTLLLHFQAVASFNVYEFESKEKEAHFQEIIKDLRCPKCQNNNLHDSNAPLATDIKNYVYHSLEAGEKEADIIAFLIGKYGEFITYKPQRPMLWLFPWLFTLALFIWVLWIIVRNKHKKRNDHQSLPSMAQVIETYEKERRHEEKS